MKEHQRQDPIVNLSKLAKSLDEIPLPHESFAPKPKSGEQNYNKTWLKGMADALQDARYGELMELSKGILNALPKEAEVTNDHMSAAIHQWASNYKGE